MNLQNEMGKTFKNKTMAGYQLQNRCAQDIHDHSMLSSLGTGKVEAHSHVNAFLLVGDNSIEVFFPQVLNP